MNIISNLDRNSGIRQHQRGSVLVIGMIFLVIIMIGAVTIMNSSVQDEKISGNSKRSSDAFMAAEAGMSAALAKLRSKDQSYNPPSWFYYSCAAGELVDPDGNVYPAGSSGTFVASTDYGDGATYTVQYGGACESDVKGIKTISLVSTGAQANSERQVHFNVAHDGDASWPAVFVNDDPDAAPPECNFDFGPSSAYEYDGKGGPALSTNTDACTDDIRDADANSGQLVGGVIANNPAPDFTDPDGGLKEFYKALKASAHTQNVYPSEPKNANKGVEPVDLNSPSFSSVDLGSPGDVSDPTAYSDLQSIIVHGDLDMPGNLSGAGVLVVTGTAHFGGTPNWDGLIIILGGNVDIGGGGTTNGLRGTMVVANLDFGGFDYCNEDGVCQSTEDPANYYSPTPREDSWDYAGSPEINWDVSGGGTARYNYGCELLRKVNNFLLDDSEADIDPAVSFPGPDSCPDTDGSGQTGSYGDIYVFDWYEEVNN